MRQARLHSAGVDAWQTGHNGDMRSGPEEETPEEPSRSLWLVMEYCSLGTLQVRTLTFAMHAIPACCSVLSRRAR